jgi:hypothetical protein
MRTGVPTGRVAELLEFCAVAVWSFGVSFRSGLATLGVEGEGFDCWAERPRLNKKKIRTQFFMIAP